MVCGYNRLSEAIGLVRRGGGAAGLRTKPTLEDLGPFSTSKTGAVPANRYTLAFRASHFHLISFSEADVYDTRLTKVHFLTPIVLRPARLSVGDAVILRLLLPCLSSRQPKLAAQQFLCNNVPKPEFGNEGKPQRACLGS